MQPLFIFSRASTGLAPAPKTLARAAFPPAHLAVDHTPQVSRKRAFRERPRRLLLAQITTPQTTNPAHGRVWLRVLIEDHPASVTA